MKKIAIPLLLVMGAVTASSQSSNPIELYTLVQKLLIDSTGYENVGGWAVGKPKTFPIKWKADKLEMSDDTAINFYRMGTAAVTINGRSVQQAGKPVQWQVMLKGPRMGYSSFSMVTAPLSTELQPKYTLDSLFGVKPFKAKLLKSCDTKPIAGYYYYELKLPKKDIIFLKLSWVTVNGATAIRLDGYDNYSKYAVKLSCK